MKKKRFAIVAVVLALIEFGTYCMKKGKRACNAK